MFLRQLTDSEKKETKQNVFFIFLALKSLVQCEWSTTFLHEDGVESDTNAHLKSVKKAEFDKLLTRTRRTMDALISCSTWLPSIWSALAAMCFSFEQFICFAAFNECEILLCLSPISVTWCCADVDQPPEPRMRPSEMCGRAWSLHPRKDPWGLSPSTAEEITSSPVSHWQTFRFHFHSFWFCLAKKNVFLFLSVSDPLKQFISPPTVVGRLTNPGVQSGVSNQKVFLRENALLLLWCFVPCG